MLEHIPSRAGHFLLESGFHTDRWFTLDALFEDPSELAPRVSELAGRLAAYQPAIVCGPLLGGAFLAQLLAVELGVRFAYTEPVDPSSPEPSTTESLFAASYRLPEALCQGVRGHSVAVVDDVVSAGSSVRATVRSLVAAGGAPIVVGSLAVLGSAALEHFAEQGLAVETLERQDFELWSPADCALCRAGVRLEDPR